MARVQVSPFDSGAGRHGDLSEGFECLVFATNRSERFLYLEITLSHSSGLSSDSSSNILFFNIKFQAGFSPKSK